MATGVWGHRGLGDTAAPGSMADRTNRPGSSTAPTQLLRVGGWHRLPSSLHAPTLEDREHSWQRGSGESRTDWLCRSLLRLSGKLVALFYVLATMCPCVIASAVEICAVAITPRGPLSPGERAVPKSCDDLPASNIRVLTCLPAAENSWECAGGAARSPPACPGRPSGLVCSLRGVTPNF